MGFDDTDDHIGLMMVNQVSCHAEHAIRLANARCETEKNAKLRSPLAGLLTIHPNEQGIWIGALFGNGHARLL